jgi:predicted  nucleic acid-binding Zn-ribbon protein
MATLDLVFDGQSFAVPKRSLLELLEHHQELFGATRYAVQSAVPRGVFDLFVSSLKNQTKIPVTKQNAASAAFSVPVDMDSLSDQVSRLERRVSSLSNPLRKIEEAIESHERRLESLRLELEGQRHPADAVTQPEIESHGRRLETLDRKIQSVIEWTKKSFQNINGNVQAVRDSVAGDIGRLESETRRVADSVTGLAGLRFAFDLLKSDFEDLQQDSTQLDSNSRGLGEEIAELKAAVDAIAKSVSGLESLRPEFDRFKIDLQQLQQGLASIDIAKARELSDREKGARPKSVDPGARPTLSLPLFPKAEKREGQVEIPMKVTKSLDGIISYLTKKHGGNVSEKRIVTITSKSFHRDPKYALRTVADLTSDLYFCSRGEPGQWVCWDFHEMRIRPTHYTLTAWLLQSWDVAGSVDGTSWKSLGEHTLNQDFNDTNTVSFSVSKPAEFRFIRLSQTGKNHREQDYLYLTSVEFFGTLFE